MRHLKREFMIASIIVLSIQPVRKQQKSLQTVKDIQHKNYVLWNLHMLYLIVNLRVWRGAEGGQQPCIRIRSILLWLLEMSTKYRFVFLQLWEERFWRILSYLTAEYRVSAQYRFYHTMQKISCIVFHWEGELQEIRHKQEAIHSLNLLQLLLFLTLLSAFYKEKKKRLHSAAAT